MRAIAPPAALDLLLMAGLTVGLFTACVGFRF
jgi:hypothetical protein